jgi:hypothetical protein
LVEELIESIKAKVMKILCLAKIVDLISFYPDISKGEAIIHAVIDDKIIPVVSKAWNFPFTIKQAYGRIEVIVNYEKSL